MKKHPKFWLLVAVSVGVWLDEIGRHMSKHAPVRHRPGLSAEGKVLPMTSHLRKTDASNRSVRTILQGLVFTVLAAIVMVLYPVFTGAHSWGDFHWSLIGFAIMQTGGTAVLAYVMRTVLDPSGIPTPLPPARSGEPSEPVGGVR